MLAVLLAVTDALFGATRTGIATSTALLAAAAFVAGGRTLVTSAFALATAPEIRPAVTGLRAATMQLGYFAGSLAGGAALTFAGYSALGATMGALFLAAATTIVRRPASQGASVERDTAPVRTRGLYRLFTEREGDRQPACDPLKPTRNLRQQGSTRWTSTPSSCTP
jgi:hypothetical protein